MFLFFNRSATAAIITGMLILSPVDVSAKDDWRMAEKIVPDPPSWRQSRRPMTKAAAG